MAIRIMVECDSCGGMDYVSETLITKTRFDKVLHFAGWSVGSQTLCPACAKPHTKISNRGAVINDYQETKKGI